MMQALLRKIKPNKIIGILVPETPYQQLREMAMVTYSPFGCPLLEESDASEVKNKIVTNKKIKKDGPLIVSTIYTGEVSEIQFPSHLPYLYGALLMLEDAGVKCDQTKNGLAAYHSPSCVRMQDYDQALRLSYMERAGRMAFKFFRDIAEGNIAYKEFAFQAYWKLKKYMMVMGRAYSGEDGLTSENKLMDLLVDIRKSRIVKTEEEVLPRFYYQLGFEESIVDMLGSTAALSQFKTLLNIVLDGPEGFRAKIPSSETALAKTFNLEDAQHFLNRNGHNYLAQLSSEKRETFWKNLSRKSDARQGQIDQYQECAYALLSGSPAGKQMFQAIQEKAFATPNFIK
jgi:hypothetical protein